MRAPDELSFREAVLATPLGEDRFRGRYPGWSGSSRVFGGVVLAQAVSAASATVDGPQAIHSLKGCFLRPASPGDEVELAVERIRDGRSFSTRQVRSLVGGRETSRFIASFAAAEPGHNYQLCMPEAPGPAGLEVATEDRHFDVIELGHAAADASGGYAWTRRAWIRCSVPLESSASLKAAAMAYASDMTSTAFYPGHDQVPAESIDASLDHSLWFHRPSDLGDWHLFELRCVAVTGLRSTVQGLLFTGDGVLCASMAQELLVRAQLSEPPSRAEVRTQEGQA